MLDLARATCDSTLTNNTAGEDAWGGEQQTGRPPPDICILFLCVPSPLRNLQDVAVFSNYHNFFQT